MTSLPPPVPYPVSHPPQYYNGTVLPQFASDMYYNMVPGTCYPMMTVNGQDTYVPYYEVGEPCNANISSEVSLENSNYRLTASNLCVARTIFLITIYYAFT